MSLTDVIRKKLRKKLPKEIEHSVSIISGEINKLSTDELLDELKRLQLQRMDREKELTETESIEVRVIAELWRRYGCIDRIA